MEIQLTTLDLGIITLIIIIGLLLVILGFRLYLRMKSKQLLKCETDSAMYKENKLPGIDIFQYRTTVLSISFIIVLIANISVINWAVDFVENDAVEYKIELPEDIEIIPPPTPMTKEKIPQVVVSEDLIAEEIEEVEIATKISEPIKTDKETVESEPIEEIISTPLPLPQTEEDQPKEYFKIVEQMPRFPGCEDKQTQKERDVCAQQKLLEFIHVHIKYPALARENGVEGMVVLQFIVEKDGSIHQPKVVRDIGAGTGEEALRVVKLMNEMNKKWIPGKQRGRPVRVQFNLPVKFELQ